MKSEDVWKVILELQGADTQVVFVACIPEQRCKSKSLHLEELVWWTQLLQTLEAVTDYSYYIDAMILGCCAVSLDLYRISRR